MDERVDELEDEVGVDDEDLERSRLWPLALEPSHKEAEQVPPPCQRDPAPGTAAAVEC
jgi:hypothetical protein